MPSIDQIAGIKAVSRAEVDPYDRLMQHELVTMMVHACQSATNPYHIGRLRGDGRVVMTEKDREEREARMKAVGFLAKMLDEHAASTEGIPWIDRVESAVETGIDPITQDRIYRSL